jgi:hypothetical protein
VYILALDANQTINLLVQNAKTIYFFLKINVFHNAQEMDTTPIMIIAFVQNALKVAYNVFQRIDVIHVMKKITTSSIKRNAFKTDVTDHVKHVQTTIRMPV